MRTNTERLEERRIRRRNYNEGRELIKEAFKQLRKIGIIARMNFSCCGNCGSHELWEKVKEDKKRGYVFYHRQDEDSFSTRGEVYLRYSGWDTEDKEKPEGWLTSRHVAEILIEKLKGVGLKIGWNGDTNTCVLVIGVDEEKREEIERQRKLEEHRKEIERIRKNIKRLAKENTFKLERTIEDYKESISDLYGCSREEAEAVLVCALEKSVVDGQILEQVAYIVRH